jgi:hypothetical protein
MDIIKNQGGPPTQWHGGVLDEIDSIFKAHFFSDNGKKLIAGFMDLEEDNVLAQFREYSEKVVDACLQESGRHVNMNLDLSQTFPSRVKWCLLTGRIPIPSTTFIAVLDMVFKQIPKVFDEVSPTLFMRFTTRHLYVRFATNDVCIDTTCSMTGHLYARPIISDSMRSSSRALVRVYHNNSLTRFDTDLEMVRSNLVLHQHHIRTVQ